MFKNLDLLSTFWARGPFDLDDQVLIFLLLTSLIMLFAPPMTSLLYKLAHEALERRTGGRKPSRPELVFPASSSRKSKRAA